MATLTPRNYQIDFVDGVKDAMRENDTPAFTRICGYMPQGSGKSVIISMIAVGAAAKGNDVLILSHRDEILKQNFDKMQRLGLTSAIVNAETRNIPEAQVAIGMSQTISVRIKNHKEWMEWLQHFNMIIVDEAHRGEHDKVMDYINEDAHVLGLSASICRNGNKVKQLGEYYDCIVKGISTPELIEMNFLVGSRNFVYQAPILEDLPVVAANGDYDPHALQMRFTRKERYAGVITNWKRIAFGTKTIVFTTGSDHCVDLTRAFCEHGIKAKYLLSSRKPETDAQFSGKREDILRNFHNGLFSVLVNVGILDTGYDEPSIQTVVLDLATKSYTHYSQMVGRGSRPYPGKSYFNVLDFGDNVKTHGKYEREDPPMGLWHDKTKGGVMPTKLCPLGKDGKKLGCGRLVPQTAQKCPYCGYVFPKLDKIYEIELTELIDTAEDQEGLEVWCAKKVLEDGWSIPRVLATVCIKNAPHEKATFMRVIKVLRTKEGKKVSPYYWDYFSKNILKNKARKRKLVSEQNELGL